MRLDYGYSEDIRVYFTPGISFTETGSCAIPPAPTADLGILHTGKVSGTNVVEYYLGSVFGIAYQQNKPIHSLGLGLAGYTGLLARLETESALTFMPYFGVAFVNNIFVYPQILSF